MIKLVWRTDVHMSVRAPSSRTDDWSETVFNKLTQVREFAEKIGAEAILDGGDFFHIKSPSRTTHELVRQVADHHADYKVPVYCTPGNHDSVYGDYGFLGQQPLGVLFSTGVYKRLYDEHEVVFSIPSDNHPPHLNFSALKVRVVGIPYHGNIYDMARFDIKKGDEDILICVAHVLASPDGGRMFEGEDIIRYSDLLDLDPNVWCFGHWHKDQGVQVLGGKTIINVGSLTRGALSQDEVQRRPACVGIFCSIEDGKPVVKTEIHRLNVAPPEDVFDVEGRARQVKQQVEMDAFVEKIREGLKPSVEGETLPDAVAGVEGVPDEVRDRALGYLEKV